MDTSTRRAVFSNSYVFIPRGCFRDIVTSALPHWHKARAWILARPLGGFAETFSQYIMEVQPGGGSTQAEPDQMAEAGLFVMAGNLRLETGDGSFDVSQGDFAYIPAGQNWKLNNHGQQVACFHWIRKRYQDVAGIRRPKAFAVNESDLEAEPMPGFGNSWTTKRFINPEDMAHDMHVNIVSFSPGAFIPFLETHVMEHGLYVLQGKGVYRLNRDEIDVEAGDFIWLRAFCPQSCAAKGNEPFRYLLYKDVNRHASLTLCQPP